MTDEPPRKKKKWKTRKRKSKSRVWKSRWVAARGDKPKAAG